MELYDFFNCKKCQKICQTYADLNSDEVFNETFIRYVERYSERDVRDPVSMFFIISRSAAKFLRQKSRVLEEIPIQWHDDLSEFQKALSDYLQNNSDTYSHVIEMYLLEPNIAKLSRETGIKKYHLKEILNNAKNRIAFQYLHNKSHDRSSDLNDCYHDHLL